MPNKKSLKNNSIIQPEEIEQEPEPEPEPEPI